MADNAQPSSRGQRVSTYQNGKTILSRNKVRYLTYFTSSIFFAKYKREEVEVRHVPSCYGKTQLPSVFFTMGRKIKTEKIWLCESVGKLKGIGKQGEVKIIILHVEILLYH